MEWKNINNLWIAQGQDGKFVIKKSCGLFWSTYIGKTNYFKLPGTRRISDAKQMCEDNYYWE